MKQNLSSVDLHYLCKEFDILIDAKVDKIYSKEDHFLLQMHVKNQGKKLLAIHLPGLIYLTQHKSDFTAPEKICIALRKYLSNTRLRSIQQKNFERILELKFEGKDTTNILIVELFSKGNIILCREDYSIIVAKDFQNWSQRTIRGGIAYQYPDKEFDALNISKEGVHNVLKDTNKESLVKALALDLGLGGVYAEELCIMSKVKKDSSDLSEKDIELIHKNLKKLLDKKIMAVRYGKKDITPFELKYYTDLEKKNYESFSSALDSYWSEILLKEDKVDKFKEKKDTILGIIRQQETQIKNMEKQADINQKKAETIYKNYIQIDDILTQLKKAREKLSWKEIKEKLKDHKVIKEIDEKNGELIIEV